MSPKSITLIAEAGVNHNGDLKKAFALVDAAAEAGADLVKFQTFSAKAMVTKSAALAEYQKVQIGTAKSQLDMLLELELDEDAHHALIAHCAARGVGFLSTPFDLPSLDLLTKTLGQSTLKIGSGDLNNAPLLLAAAQSKSNLILSTGMASLGQIEMALGLLALGYSDTAGAVQLSRDDMISAWADPNMRRVLREKVTILHCVSNYPASAASTNLKTLATLGQAFGLPVGYSDHTLGGSASIAAAALGATCIEKHLTLDKTMNGPDHAASSEPDELHQIFAAIREVEAMLGTPVKACTPEERCTASAARKRLVARSDVREGELFTQDNITTKRATMGSDPMMFWEVLGTPATRDYSEGEPISV